MILLECDYHEGAHPLIMQRLMETNMEQTFGYGTDAHCKHAADLIKTACEKPDANVHFLVGGTQTNKTIIAAALRPHQGVIAAVTGHINVHETGAIEATGHKVLPLPSDDGKITADQITSYCAAHYAEDGPEHMVQPGMVYISSPTENGTIYHADELRAIRRVCDKYNLYLFLDGARLGYGLMSSQNDLTLPLLAELTDVFYIGGTKVGALFGEAVVITNDTLNSDFRYLIKQNGGMLAKGRLLGIQFETLFEHGLYFEIARHAISLSDKLTALFKELQIPTRYDSPTNQVYPIFENRILAEIVKKYAYAVWEKIDEDHTAIRFCTSWATKEEDVDALIKDIRKLMV